MFFLGVYLGEEAGTAQVVAVEKEFFSGAKRYRVAHAETLREPDAGSLKKALLRMFFDERWTTVKKVFSQDGRPPKIKSEPPLLLLSAWNDDVRIAGQLNGDGAQVEVVVGAEPEGYLTKWLDENAFQVCHVVTAGMMVGSVNKALTRGSLKSEELTSKVASSLLPLAQALLDPSGRAFELSRFFPWMSAFGSCLWHGESIRRIKRY